MKNVVLVLLISLCMISCSNDDRDANQNEVDFTLIGKGELLGNGEEGIEQSNLVITNEGVWIELMQKMNSVNDTTDDFTETGIDFTEFQVIAVFDKIRDSSGFSITIKNVEQNANGIFVSYIIDTPEGNNPTLKIQPFHIIKIKTTDDPITFVEIE